MNITPHQTVSPSVLSWKFIIRSFPHVTVLLGETSKTRETSVEQEVKKMSSVQESAALQRQDRREWCTKGAQRLHNVVFLSLFILPNHVSTVCKVTLG